MSRIGKLPIPIPKGVKVQITGNRVVVNGPNGSLTYEHRPEVRVAEENGHLLVQRVDEGRQGSSMQGLTRTLINNMVVGVTQGYTRELDINGVGWRAEVKGDQLALTVGFTNPVEVAIPKGITVRVDKNTHIVLQSSDKQQVGEFAAIVRKVRPPEPYQGKGIKYTEEVLRRKEGKTSG
ncbi:MAG: 50S ribosomal protein L6 [Myxococcales bacterium]|nr:50S ribosomal protein L6 [Myxococcales bacterium]